MNTYPEMNKQIVGLLRMSDNPVDLYAAQYIEELQKKLTIAEDQSGLYDALPTVIIREPQWISVNERLPEFSNWTLVTCDELGGWITRIAIYDAWDNVFEEIGSGENITKHVTHWMSLPKPPKKEKEKT